MRQIMTALTVLVTALTLRAQTAPASLKILVLVDQSGSMSDTKVAPPTTAELKMLAEAVANVGGDIAFGLISSHPEPFIRAHFEVPPEKPPEVSSANMNIFVAAQRKAEYRKANDAYQQKVQARQALVAARLQTFLDSIARLQLQPPSHSTNIVDGIARASVFFNEPTSQPTALFLLCTSDGQETSHQPLRSSLPQSLTTIVVHRDSDIGILAQLAPRPVQFENTGSAITYILQGGN